VAANPVDRAAPTASPYLMWPKGGNGRSWSVIARIWRS